MPLIPLHLDAHFKLAARSWGLLHGSQFSLLAHDASLDFRLDCQSVTRQNLVMILSSDVRAIIDGLLEEGYAWTVSELLENLAVGRPADVTAGDVDDYDFAEQTALWTSVGGGRPIGAKRTSGEQKQIYAESNPIPEAEQLAFTLEFINLRLVEPFSRLADAERIANRLVASDIMSDMRISAAASTDFETVKYSARPIKFKLTDAVTVDDDSIGFEFTAVEELAAALRSISDFRVNPEGLR